MKKTVLLIVVVLLLVFTVYFLSVDKDNKSLSAQLKVSIIEKNSGKEISKFSLIDHNNKKFSNDNLKNKWTVWLFVYTHCPDVCPTELSIMTMLEDKIAKNGIIEVPNFVAITFDPIRDTPKVLKKYITYFNKDFLGISGDQKQINQLVSDFSAYYDKTVYGKDGKLITLKSYEMLPDDAIEKGYIINHTAFIYLINPEGKLYATFPTPHNAVDMAKDIELIIKNY